MEPGAIIVSGVILVILCILLLFLGKEILSRRHHPHADSDKANRGTSYSIVVTVSEGVLFGLLVTSILIGREILFPENSSDTRPSQAEVASDQQLSPKQSKPSSNATAESVNRGQRSVERAKALLEQIESQQQTPEDSSDRAGNQSKALLDRNQNATEQDQSVQRFYRQAVKRINPGQN